MSGSRERSKVLHQADNQKVEGSLFYVNNMQHSVTIAHIARYVQVKFVSKLKYLDIYLVPAKCFRISVNQLKVKFFHVLIAFMHILKLLTLKWLR